MKINKKIKALAKLEKVKKGAISIDEDNKEWHLFRIKNHSSGFYVLTKDELEEREFETFESCYYEEYKASFKKVLYDLFDHYNEKESLVNKILAGMLKTTKEAFRDTKFLEDSVKQYKKMDGFFIIDE